MPRSAVLSPFSSSDRSIHQISYHLDYLLQQLQVASFLGIIAAGLMLVILLGQIDLSIPWVVTIGGMMSTAAAGWGQVGNTLAIPFGIACGLCGSVSSMASGSPTFASRR